MIANKTPLRCLFAYNSIDSLNTINFSFVFGFSGYYLPLHFWVLEL